MDWEAEIDTLTRLLEETGMASSVKWNHPVYVHHGRNVASCHGALLTDEAGHLENAQEGRTQAMRHWKFRKGDAIPEDTVRAYLAEAMRHAELGRTVPKPAPDASDITWCAVLEAAFEADPEFKSAMLALTPGRQRDYNVHIGSAKREATQLSRLEKIRPLVHAGKGLNDHYRSR